MTRLPKALFIAATSLATTGVAFAQDSEAPSEEAAPPPEATPAPTEGAATAGEGPQLTLGTGKILIAGSTLNMNLSTDAVGKPISLAPSVWYGVNEKLTVGLTHDGGTTPWTPRPGFRSVTVSLLGMTVTGIGGAGICLTGDENGCSGFYDNVGVDALYSLKQGKLSIAAHPALDVFSFDPFTLSLRAGVLGTYAVSDKITVAFDPRIKIGLTERDFNKEAIDIPVWAWYAVNDKLGAYVNLGISGPFDGFGDAFSIPLGIGASYKVSDKLTAGGDFAFLNLLGNGGGADARGLTLRAAYAL